MKSRWSDPIYCAWYGMKQRCLHTENAIYKNYGGRGITIDPSWLEFENFRADMSPMPARTQLDRKDNDGNYCKSNCRWVTLRVNTRNKRNTIHVIYEGSLISMAEASELSGINPATVRSRWLRGDIDNTLFRPVAKKHTLNHPTKATNSSLQPQFVLNCALACGRL
jgi:hypothetical protein